MASRAHLPSGGYQDCAAGRRSADVHETWGVAKNSAWSCSRNWESPHLNKKLPSVLIGCWACCSLAAAELKAAECVCLASTVIRAEVWLQDELSGADIKAMCTEAGLLALRERRMRVTQADFSKSRDKVCRLTDSWRCFLLENVKCFLQ